MRLTLRTLLAYLDNILEPEDRELLEKKVQDSEFAQNLIQRSRETVNDQELSALDPVGHGMRQDPNSVAEYLDNTMPREQIEEFERLCIENGPAADIHLAEITSCHHILTMVLGDPVQFSASSRDRMYRIGESNPPHSSLNNEEQDLQSQDSIDGTESTAPINSEDSNRNLEDSFNPADLLPVSKVPDYLRGEETRNRWLPIIATTLVAAVVTGVLLILFDSSSAQKKSTEDEAIAKSDSQEIPIKNTASLAEVSNGQGTAPPPVLKSEKENSAAPVSDEILPLRGLESKEVEADAHVAVPDKPAENTVISSDEPEKQNPPTVPSEGKQVVADPPSSSSLPETGQDSSGNEILNPNTEGSVVTAASTDSLENDDKNKITDAAEPTEPTTVSVNQVLGRLVSNDQILLVTDKGYDELRWLPPKSSIKAGHSLLALPTFRPNLTLLAFTVELEGGSLLELLDRDAGGIPTIQLSYGRMVVRTNVNDGTFHLKISDQRFITLTLNNTETVIGVEVLPKTPLGQDPETAVHDYTINIFALSGNVDWQEGDLQGVIEAGQLQSLNRLPPSEPESFSLAPAWLTEVQMSKLESRAVPSIRGVLQDDRSVKLSFLELVEKRRQVEVKQLALRCCAHIGYFDPLVEALGDETMDRRWEKCAMYLQDSVRRNPEYARRVRESMERMRDDDGVDLYRMLWGYTNENLLNNGQAEQLVEFLESEDLDLRVLSHWNLKNITGKGLAFQPNKSESKRRQSLKRWQVLLKKGEIKYKPE